MMSLRKFYMGRLIIAAGFGGIFLHETGKYLLSKLVYYPLVYYPLVFYPLTIMPNITIHRLSTILTGGNHILSHF